jgi:hypothetical protein
VAIELVTGLLASVAPIYDAIPFVLGQVFTTTYLGEAYWRAGQHDAAQRTLMTNSTVPPKVVRLVGRRVGIHGGCTVASQHSVGPLEA